MRNEIYTEVTEDLVSGPEICCLYVKSGYLFAREFHPRKNEFKVQRKLFDSFRPLKYPLATF